MADAFIHTWIESVPEHLRAAAEAAVSGGRRFRPSLLAALLGDDVLAGSKGGRAMLAIELLHRASLIVDDVVDGDLMRRGAPVFAVEYGDDYAAVLPHFFVAEGIASLAPFPDHQQHAVQAYRRMALGQLADLRPASTATSLLAFYEQCVLEKTRPLFELVMSTAAVCSGAVAPDHALRVGRMIGDIFQMANDLFDTDPELQDVRSRKRFQVVTIDLVTALAVDRGDVPVHSITALAGKRVPPDQLRTLRRRISAPHIRREAESVVMRAVEDAKVEIQRLPYDWQTLLTETLEWMTTRAFWDHREHEGAGYAKPSAVA